MRQVIRADGIPFLVAMATSEHLVMQNEALVSLTLIAATVLGKIFALTCFTGPKVIKLFSCSTQLSVKFILHMNVKMPTILTFMSMINY